jgi:small-conductance mechanosensitive channel
MMKRLFTTTAILLTSVAVPASAQSREQRQMMADVRMLQEQTQELAVAIATVTQALQDSIKALNQRLDQANDTTRKGFADQKVIFDDMGKDLRAIRERVDDTNVRVSNVREELEAMRSSIPFRPRRRRCHRRPIPMRRRLLRRQPDRRRRPRASRRHGCSIPRWPDYAAGQFTLAVTGFEAFLRTFPRSEMADDAQFQIGESYFALNRWTDAIAAYNAGHAELPDGRQGVAGVLQARARAGAPRADRCGAGIVEQRAAADAGKRSGAYARPAESRSGGPPPHAVA